MYTYTLLTNTVSGFFYKLQGTVNKEEEPIFAEHISCAIRTNREEMRECYHESELCSLIAFSRNQ